MTHDPKSSSSNVATDVTETVITRLREATTVLDEPFHREAVAATMIEAADHLSALQQQRDEAIYVPHQWKCAMCGFVVSKMLLRASDGAVGIDRREIQDVCPNDGTSLTRVTWEESALESGERAIAEMKRAEAAEQERDETVQALKTAVRTIRTWHGMGLGGAHEAQAWALYQASPEMQTIKAALMASSSDPETP